VVLAVVGLIGIEPAYAAATATIAAGVAFFAQGVALATAWPRVAEDAPGVRDSALEISAAINAELVGGTTAIALGVLALLGVAPEVLLPVALLVFAGVLIFTTSGEGDLGAIGGGARARAARAARNATVAASGAQMVVAIAVDALGILALAQTRDAILLTLLGLVIVGASALLTGVAVGGRMLAVMRR
jgi:hypothetical protein